MAPTDITSAADENFVVHITWLQQWTSGMKVRRTNDVIWTDSGLPCDTFNIVCHTRWDESDARVGIQGVLDEFRARDRPFSWWVGPRDLPQSLGVLLQERGLSPDESELAMVLNLSDLTIDAVATEPLRIRRVRTQEELKHFAKINAANWNPPDTQIERYYERVAPAALRADCPLRFYVGYLDEKPVATSELTVGGTTAGLYNISTIQEYRRRGFGTAMTTWPLLEAQREGAEIAILQAAPAGVGIYSRVGFRPYAKITEYKPNGV